MPIFRLLNLGNEVPNLVSEFQNALVFLGLTLLASGGVGAAQGPPGVVFSNSGPLEPPKPLEKWIQVPERKKYVDFIKTGWCGMFPVEKKAFLDPKVGNVV